MTQINQNYDIKNSYPQRTGSSNRANGKNASQINIPNYYYVPESYSHTGFKDIVKENPIYQMLLKPFIEHPIAIVLTWLGLGYGIDKYSQACSGKYEDSLVKKAANFGDSIQESAVVQSKPVQSVLGVFKKVGKQGGKMVENSAVLRAVRDTSSLPEWEMVKSQMFNHKQEVVQDFVKIADGLKLAGDGAPELKDLGLTKAEKQMLYKKFNVTSLANVSGDKAANYLLLQRLGRDEKLIDKILKNETTASALTKKEILKELGLSVEDVKAIKEDVFGKYIEKVEQATGKAGHKVRIGGGHYNWMGPLTKPFERTIACDEIHNKLFSLSKGAKTATGRFTSKLMQMAHRCLTFGQGKLAALIFIAPILIETAMNVKKADKDQKVGTAVGGLIENTSWIVTWPIALRCLHKFGGIQYAGMSKDQVNEYRKIVNEFNQKTKKSITVNGETVPNPNVFKSKAEYSAEKAVVKQKLKELKTVKGQNIFTKGLRKLARFLTMDLETLHGCNSGNFFQNFGSKIGNVFRNIGGVPLRLAIFFGLAMGVFDGTISKIVAKIFGKSYDSMKHDEHKENKKAQKQFLYDDLNKRMYEAQAKKQEYDKKSQKNQNIAMRGRPQTDMQLSVMQDEPVDNYTYIPSQENIIPHPKGEGRLDNYTYVPSQDNVIPKDENNQTGIKRSYIPSQEPANIQKTFDNSGLEDALKRADKAEAFALKILAGNFDGLK